MTATALIDNQSLGVLPEVLNEICIHFTQYFTQYKTDIDGSIERVYFEYVTETSTSRSAVSATTLIDIKRA